VEKNILKAEDLEGKGFHLLVVQRVQKYLLGVNSNENKRS